MRPEQNPLDLNNLPEEYGERWRDGKQILEESSLAAAAGSSVDLNSCRKKKNGKEGKEECGKVYECRFCSLKFCKSQALGGHMNRHRQERETETLNRARQLVFSNENLAGQVPHLGLRDPNLGMGDPSLPFSNLVYPRLPSASSSPMLSPQAPLQPYLYPSSSRLSSYPSPYPPSVNDYFVGHAFSGNSHHHPNLNYAAAESNYTCVGAPLAHSFPPEGIRPPSIGDGSSHNRTDGVNWSLNPPSINRFQDDF